MICNMCPRKCGAERGVDRNPGFCQMPSLPVVARAALHLWEEPCISGENGSGAVFFSGCALSCVYCQNAGISHGRYGKRISVNRLAEIFRELELAGAENINLVNPTHYVAAIKAAFDIYRPSVPVVYNSGGYDSAACMDLAAGFADIFLMDLKYLSPDRALKFSGAENYPETAAAAIKRAAEITGGNVFDERGIMKKGLIVRHLVLPQGTNEAIRVIDWTEKNVPDAALSLMSQYVPCGDLSEFPEINRRITRREYKKVLDYAENSRIACIYKQDLSSSSDDFIPPFDLTGC